MPPLLPSPAFPAMAFKDSPPQFQMINVSAIDPNPRHVRQTIGTDTLKGLANSVHHLGLIQPIIVRPGEDGRYVVIAGERRRQAAIQAGEVRVPVIVRACTDAEALEVQVFENIGLGVRAALEPRDMANAIHSIAQRFDSPEEAAQYFGRAPTWLTQATAAAKLSNKVTALLDAGKISSAGAAVEIEKLVKKNEAEAESLIGQIEQLPDGKKVSKKTVDAMRQTQSARAANGDALPSVSPSASNPAPAEPTPAASADPLPPGEAASREPFAVAPDGPRPKINPGKVKRVAQLLGLSEEDEEELLARLIDEFLALKGA